MDHDKIIDDLGGTTRVAALCRVTDSAVSQWRRAGIPDARLMFLQVKFPKVFGIPKPARRTKTA